MDAAYRKVATTDEFAPGEVKPLRLPGARVALYNSGGTFYAIGDACTHAGGILSSGEFGGEYVQCARHGAEFEVKTGDALTPPARGPVPRYDVKVEDGGVYVALPLE